ncbi:putative LPS assembly protein LptD [Pedobacter sp. PLR]|uniref:putative LPS assembly protein LptD n=1 Tax=Pedobacter sp. PLR TaxID=2994465 RepID=UPI0022455455|nr:putative LPS assembly protein LptD [Pedobacter sp. PLR]MCX2453604.1 putative LPS assembly protein LptD [Pedobacter sp. PLR]
MKLLTDIIFTKRLVLLTFVGILTFVSPVFSSPQQVTPVKGNSKKVPVPADTKSTAIPADIKNGPISSDKKSAPVNAAPQDTTKTSDKLEYSAKDSTKVNKKDGTVYLYGRARVIYQGLELDADYITYNDKTKTIFASGVKNSKGKYVGRPIFKMPGQGNSIADSLRYNTETGAGKIYGVFSEQEGGFFSGGVAKKQPDDEIHSKGQIYSTCNLPHPHFGLHITKGIVTEKQIITGPVYLEIEDIPLPLGLPFAFFPKPNKKSSGIILPSPGEDYTRGFFLREGGYYIGFNDYWDAKLLGTIYTRGSHQLDLSSNYTKRYKYNGNVALSYGSNRYGIEGTPEYQPVKDYSIRWSHSQNANANPGSTFSASVDIRSQGYNKNTAVGGYYDPTQLSRNNLGSSISYTKMLAGGLFNLSMAARVDQDISLGVTTLLLPDVNLGMTRNLYPFASKNSVGDPKWYEKISVGYSMQSSNSVTAGDSVLFERSTLNKFRNGVQHNIPIAMNFNVLEYFNFNTSINYTERWHFQSIRKEFMKATGGGEDLVKIDTIPGFNRYGTYTVGGGVTTKIYSTAQFTNLGKLKAIRHVMTPSVSFGYTPNFADPKYGNYLPALYGGNLEDPVRDKEGNKVYYAKQEGMLYGPPGTGSSANISFGIQNNVEAKVLVPNDTTGKGEKKIPLINNLSITSSYNLLAKSFKLSNFNVSGSTPFSDKFQVNYQAVLNPYVVGDTTINGLPEKVLLDTYSWQRGRLPRVTSFGFSFDYSLNPEALKRRNDTEQDRKMDAIQKGLTPEQSEALAKVSRDPNAFVDFNIPWNFAFRYSFDYSTDAVGRNRRITNSLSFNGDANITPKWKVTFDSGWNFETNSFAITRFGIYRDLHCWDMSFSWIPFGTQQMYSVDIKVKASVLQDLKLSKRKNYYTRY